MSSHDVLMTCPWIFAHDGWQEALARAAPQLHAAMLAREEEMMDALRLEAEEEGTPQPRGAPTHERAAAARPVACCVLCFMRMRAQLVRCVWAARCAWAAARQYEASRANAEAADRREWELRVRHDALETARAAIAQQAAEARREAELAPLAGVFEGAAFWPGTRTAALQPERTLRRRRWRRRGGSGFEASAFESRVRPWQAKTARCPMGCPSRLRRASRRRWQRRPPR